MGRAVCLVFVYYSDGCLIYLFLVILLLAVIISLLGFLLVMAAAEGLLATALILGPYIALKKVLEIGVFKLSWKDDAKISIVEIGLAIIGLIIFGEIFLVDLIFEVVMSLFGILWSYNTQK